MADNDLQDESPAEAVELFVARMATEGRGGNAQVAVVAINFAKNTPHCE